MAIDVIDGTGVDQKFKVSGSGTSGDPLIASVNVEAFGAEADSAASSDGATATYISLFKRLLTRLTTLLSGGLPAALDGSGGLKVAVIAGGGTGGGPVTIADGDDASFGAKADSAAAGDTSTASFVALFKRLLQRLTTLIGLLPTALGSGGGLKVDGSGTALPISGTVTANAGSGTMTVDSELPSAAALADAESNPTAPAVGSHLLAWNGASWDRVRVASKGYDMSAVAITTIATVATPTSGKKWRLMSGTFSVSAACSVLFEDNAGGTTVFRTPKLLADTPYSFDLGGGYLSAAANNVLKATASTGTVSITGTLRVTEE